MEGHKHRSQSWSKICIYHFHFVPMSATIFFEGDSTSRIRYYWNVMPPQTTNNLTESCDQTIQNHCDSMANTFLVNCLLDGFKKPKLSVFTDPLAKKAKNGQQNYVLNVVNNLFLRLQLLIVFIHDSYFSLVCHPFLHTHRHIVGTHGGCWRIWNTFSHILDKCKFLSSNTPYLSILVHQWTIQACKKNTKNA